MEIRFGTLKTILVRQACYKTGDAARHGLFACIEGYYNCQRLHSVPGISSPDWQSFKPLNGVRQIRGRSTSFPQEKR